MAFEGIRAVVEEELSRPLEHVFARFEAAPVAAASIGQVHRAQLQDGRVVAVKVQYPGVDAAVRADLKNLGLLLAPTSADQAIAALSRWRSLHAEAARTENVPAEYLLARRMGLLVLSVLGRLRAEANRHRIAREWPHGEPPSTELGEAGRRVCADGSGSPA